MTRPNREGSEMACKHGDPMCGVQWDCGKCSDAMRRAAYSRLTQAEKDYDNMVDPKMAYHTDYDRFDRCCSCHINPPCSYCVNKDDPDQEAP